MVKGNIAAGKDQKKKKKEKWLGGHDEEQSSLKMLKPVDLSETPSKRRSLLRRGSTLSW